MANVKSMAELEKGVHYAHDVLESFKDYAESGAAIIPEVCIKIIKTTKFNDKELVQLKQILIKGMEIHFKKRGKSSEFNEARKYAQVLKNVDPKALVEYYSASKHELIVTFITLEQLAKQLIVDQEEIAKELLRCRDNLVRLFD